MIRHCTAILACAALLVPAGALAQRTYDLSDAVVGKTPWRSTYHRVGATTGDAQRQFEERADRSRPVVVHSHGCSGVVGTDLQLAEFYKELGFHVVLLQFHTRGDASSSCPSGMPSSTGHAESGNPHRIKARRMELEHQIAWLEDLGFKSIVATGHSEGGKVVQGLKRKVDGVILHAMDCKERSLWDPHPDNRYLALYSTRDPWITGNGSYPTRACGHLFNRSQVRDVRSTVTSHDPLADPAWRDEIRQFLGGVQR